MLTGSGTTAKLQLPLCAGLKFDANNYLAVDTSSIEPYVSGS
jgi:hypothetical protein